MRVIDPYVPDGQYEREIRLVRRSAGSALGWIFEADEPLGWDGPLTNRVVLAPRGLGTWDGRDDGSVIADGCLHVDDPTVAHRGFTAQLDPDGS